MNYTIKELIECKEGDVIHEDVVDMRSGIILCQEGTVLTKEMMAWLSKFNHSDLQIRENKWIKVWDIDEKIVEGYTKTKTQVNMLLKSLKDSKVLDKAQLEIIKNSFQQELSSNSTIMGCVNIIKSVDEYTYAHSMNVGMLGALIGKWLKLEEKQVQELFITGVLHDAGKYKVNPKVINKKGPFNAIDYALVKKHVVHSYEMIKENEAISQDIKEGVLSHHERMDHSGYPRELGGDEIHLYGRIIAIADVYDAMISERVYKKRQTPFEVMEAMLKESIHQLDTSILLTFLKNIANYYIGVYVKLSTGQVGEVIFIHPHCVYRPIVKVDQDYIDLDTQAHIKIEDIV